MKISAKVDYACRVLAELARLHGKSELARIEHLSRTEQVPSQFLAQILSELRNGGLLTSRRGIQGGYALARPPDQISLLDIITIIEGDVLDLNNSQKGRSARRMQEVCSDVRETLIEKTKTYTLDQLISRAPEEMYYI
jgi:Rrf2 family protein